jgi:transposase
MAILPAAGPRWRGNAGRTAAVLTSFITTCKRLGINPFAYLRDIFERISTHPASRLTELLPDQ